MPGRGQDRATQGQGARRLRHHVALQLAKKAGRPPREVAEAGRRAAAGRPTASPRSTSPARASSTSRSTRPPQGELARTVVDGRRRRTAAATRWPASGSTWSSSRPTRPARCTSAASAGPRSATRSRRMLQATGAEVDPRVLLQRRRRADRPVRRARCWPRRKGEPTPEDGYGGDYIAEIAAAVVAAEPDGARPARRRAPPEVFRREGVELMFAEIQPVAAPTSASHFDVYFHEKDLHDRGELDAALDRLREQGHVFEPDGATWLRTTDFGDDKDRVLRQVRRRAGPTSPPTAPTTWTSASAASTRSSIMLGADHHGYVGRLQGAGRLRSATTPTSTSRSCIGQMVNLFRDGAAAADEQAGRHRRHARGPGRRDRRRRRPVRAGPLLGRLARSTSTSTCWTRQHQRQPGLLRAVRARPASPALLRNAADLGLDRGRRLRRRRCSTTSGRATCSARSASSRGWSRRRPSCASRTGSRATSRSWPAPTTGSTTPAGCCRWATRRSPTCHRARLWLVEATRRCSPTASPARRQRAGADVDAMRAHPAGPRHGELRPRGRLRGGPPADLERARPGGLAARRDPRPTTAR